MAVVSEMTPRVAQRATPRARSKLSTRQSIRSSSLALGEARRAWNRDRIGLVSDLRCECTRPSCEALVPAVADTHRKEATQFIIASTHFDGGLVVRVADRFFVIELCGDGSEIWASP
jgi:hypothetical protein